jgi:hypothetical protein
VARVAGGRGSKLAICKMRQAVACGEAVLEWVSTLHFALA